LLQPIDSRQKVGVGNEAFRKCESEFGFWAFYTLEYVAGNTHGELMAYLDVGALCRLVLYADPKNLVVYQTRRKALSHKKEANCSEEWQIMKIGLISFFVTKKEGNKNNTIHLFNKVV
jgi:hypothetical protein